MRDLLFLVFLIAVTSVTLNKCANGNANASSPGTGKHPLQDVPVTYVMAARDGFNGRYVFNPYNSNERLYIGAAPEGTLLLDPAGRPYVVGP